MMEDPKQAEARARGRFMIISILRLSGVAFVIAALLIINRALPLPVPIGWVLLMIGLIDVFVVPLLLARAWRSPLP